jgi:hypothetical protein
MGRFTHWSHPGGGESSSGISTATAQELPASAGSCCAPTAASDRASVAAVSRCSAAAAASGLVSVAAGTWWPSTADATGNAAAIGAAGYASASGLASAATAARRASSTSGACRSSKTVGCGSAGEATSCGLEASAAPCELALAAAASLAPARGALDERCRVGMDASALSTLAGARGGTVGTTLRRCKQAVRFPHDGHATPRMMISGLEEEKARFLFLEVPADVAGAAGATAAAPPAISTARTGASATRTDASEARADASAARAASVVDCLVAGASAPTPGDATLATRAGSGDGGAGSHLSGRACPLVSSSSSSFSSDDEYSSVPGEESPCCSRSRNSSLLRSRRFRCRVAHSFLRAGRSRYRCYAARVSARERGVGGSDFAALTRTNCGQSINCVNNSEN